MSASGQWDMLLLQPGPGWAGPGRAGADMDPGMGSWGLRSPASDHGNALDYTKDEDTSIVRSEMKEESVKGYTRLRTKLVLFTTQERGGGKERVKNLHARPPNPGIKTFGAGPQKLHVQT
ncbi:DExH-box ATP-dependent RNA helicase DExH11 [Frankliniella fusca]|uniref:DExH-box ATP-dependent RNA helicase DExH11 n=1 Tax=Frankliniella fusca TaxID=407009 RepID=A0AAE1HP91_9NEOP|nr:DExH-box ATP-dependent RNA helicase DExH11 [Frankliniella fusca]